jgi:hypothetical protein
MSSNCSQYTDRGDRQNGEREAVRFGLSPSCRLSLPEDDFPQLKFILQALRTRTMPILLSINPPFELLLLGAFVIVCTTRNRSST